jgi:hypothetical protein
VTPEKKREPGRGRASRERLLGRIQEPRDLKSLSDDELQRLAQEVRESIIDTVGEIGGHFGGRDHSTVLYACEKMERESARSQGTRALLERLSEAIGRRAAGGSASSGGVAQAGPTKTNLVAPASSR